jgi:hypothetical protein
MTTLDRLEEWTRRNTDGSKTHELHLWVGDLEAPARPRRRATDAAAGAIGEMPPGRPLPNVGPEEPPEQRGRHNQSRGPTVVGGLPEPALTQSAEPPVFIDAQSLRVSGRDQRGQNWEALISGGSNPHLPRGWPQILPDEFENTADMALRDLVTLAGQNEVAGLGQLQKLLNLTYAQR